MTWSLSRADSLPFFKSHRSLFLFDSWQYVSIRAGWVPDVMQPAVSGINDLHDLWGHMVSSGQTELTMLVNGLLMVD